MRKGKFIFCILFWISAACSGYSQQIVSPSTTDTKPPGKKKFYQTGLFKASIVPTILMGWGISTIHGHGLYSSFDAYRDAHKLGFERTHVDDILQYAPYVELVGLNLINIRCKNDFINTALLLVKSEILMNALVWSIKTTAGVIRPDSVDPARNQSFPSGHTANAFLAASMVHKEFKHKSIWYGVGAYTVATAVGALRVLNNRHWESDVFMGAGIGMLSVHLSYLTHKYRWGRKCEAMILPSYSNGNFGICFRQKL